MCILIKAKIDGFVAIIYIDDIANEKKRAKKLFKSEIEAKEFLDRFNLVGSKEFKEQNYTLKELLEKILENKFKNNKISEKQFALLSGVNNKIYQESFSNKKIKDITYEELNNFF